MGHTTTIELFKEEMKFSAGHFTIFGKGHRENLHGHNFTVYVSLTGVVGDDGLLFDYGEYKKWIIATCKAWNETFMLPTRSPHLQVHREENGDIRAIFPTTAGDEVLRFLKRDITLLDAANVSLEELARLFGEGLVKDGTQVKRDRIARVVVKCASGPGQWATWEWNAS